MLSEVFSNLKHRSGAYMKVCGHSWVLSCTRGISRGPSGRLSRPPSQPFSRLSRLSPFQSQLSCVVCALALEFARALLILLLFLFFFRRLGGGLRCFFFRRHGNCFDPGHIFLTSENIFLPRAAGSDGHNERNGAPETHHINRCVIRRGAPKAQLVQRATWDLSESVRPGSLRK